MVFLGGFAQPESGTLLQPLVGVTGSQKTPGKSCIGRSWSQGHRQKWRSGMSQPARGTMSAQHKAVEVLGWNLKVSRQENSVTADYFSKRWSFIKKKPQKNQTMRL